jgi:hypothetical protein
MPVARELIPNTHQYTNWEASFCARSVQQMRDVTTEGLFEAVFSIRSVPICYKQYKSRV